jgi:hypothetical protein
VAKLEILAGATNVSVNIFVQNSSLSTGAGLTGFATAGGSLLSGMTCYYSFGGANAGSVVQALSVPATVGAAFVAGQIVEIDATHMAGVARLDLPNAALAAGNGRFVTVMISGGTNVAPVVLEIELTATNNQDGVRGGMTALPNVVPAATGGLITVGTGSGQINPNGTGGVPANDLNGNALATFAEVSNIAVTGAALNVNAASETLTTGSDTGGVANTNTLDGVFDQWAQAGGTIDGYYQFNLSATTGATGTVVTWDGYLAGATNTVKVFAYNWGNAAWDQIGTIAGTAGTTVASQEFDLTNSHTGTGGNLGLIRIRFQNTGLTGATLFTDRILLGYAVVLTPPANFSQLGIQSNGHLTQVDTVTNVVPANMTQIAGSSPAATNLSASALAIVPCTIDTSNFAPTTTAFETSSVSPAIGNLFVNRTVLFTSGALQYEVATITAYSQISGKGHFTVTAMVGSPSNGDSFVIL